jgi:AraC-like DNA-binding protein
VQLRTLQRRFLRQVGVSPKRLARIVRFHHVCLAWRRDPASLARVAADCGYCDESHLVRDFRAFVGEPPASFLRSLPTFTSHFL